jgi:hypothetical protein
LLKNESFFFFCTIVEPNAFNSNSSKQFNLKLAVGLFYTAKFISVPAVLKGKNALNNHIVIALFVNRNNKNTTQ